MADRPPIERKESLAALPDAARCAAAGQRSILFPGRAAGIGKTSLLRAFAKPAKPRAARDE